MTRSFWELLPEAKLLLVKAWIPLSAFALLSIPFWFWMGSWQTPDYSILLINPRSFIIGWIWHSVKLSLAVALVAVITLAPATRWLLLLYRNVKTDVSIADLWIGAAIPALLDMLIGLTAVFTVVGVSVALFILSMQILPSQGIAQITLAILVAVVFLVLIVSVLLMIVYPRLRWLAIASLSGDAPLSERLRAMIRPHKGMQKVLWSVTATEQTFAFCLSLVGAILAFLFMPHDAMIPSYSLNAILQSQEPLSALQPPPATSSGPLLALLNSLGWLAIWVFLPVWVVAYERMPKPVTALTEAKSNRILP
ncbi:MAG: hypothetical protein OEM52_06560 [bacterium]|nr:hypothetical protein [bacterium]